MYFLLKKHLRDFLQPFGSRSSQNLASKISEYRTGNMTRVLNVAEKNDAAKNIAGLLSHGNSTRREGFSKFNKLYEFDMTLQGRKCHMVMTSVSGHLLNYTFTGKYKQWHACNPLDLFHAPVVKRCIENMENIQKTLESEAKKTNWLIIWTDCDREGENIGFEIIEVCKAINPNIKISRAKFSEITHQSINRAVQNLGEPDERTNKAVNVRSELDLRIGAAFTRFQTMRLQRIFPQTIQSVVSYGSCQFPTLGFVVERYKAIQNFIPEPFWKIKVTHLVDNILVDYAWSRVRLFDELACQVLLDKCQENPTAKVINVKTKEKSKWRPLPLDTVELEKLSSRKLKINAKETMKIAEKLYMSGHISYPRTETNIFPNELNLVPLVQMQTGDDQWGAFANEVIANGPNPRQGRKSDQAHPPIHPTKYASNFNGNEKKVYDFIVRHFLACISKDAKGMETVVDININGEQFSASGLMILEKNYLEVYPYDKWSDKEMPIYQLGQTFEPTSLEMISSATTPPCLLTEADLIALMEKHGIGTDATHAEHIETIKSRLYVGLQDTRFVPGELGMGLVEGYDAMGFQMSKPHLRSELEADLKRIISGEKDPEAALQQQIQSYKNVFIEATRQADKIDGALAQFFNEAPQVSENNEPPTMAAFKSVAKCRKCGSDIVVSQRKGGGAFFLSCQGFPDCKECLWFPDAVKQVVCLDEKCQQCVGQSLLKFEFTPRAFAPFLPTEYTGCIGCDETLTFALRVKFFPPKNTCPATNQSDSGYSSTSSVRATQSRPILTNQTNRNTPNNTENRRKPPNTVSNGISINTQQNDDNPIVCNCGTPATRLIVRKEGPNKGRPFYKCSKPQGNQCSFFLMMDHDGTDNTTNQNNFHTRAPGHNNRGAKRKAPGDSKPIKCGNCGQLGHNKRSCTNK